MLRALSPTEMPAMIGQPNAVRPEARRVLPGLLERAARGERRPGSERDPATPGGQRLEGALLTAQEQQRPVGQRSGAATNDHAVQVRGQDRALLVETAVAEDLAH